MALIAVLSISCVSSLGRYQYTLNQYNHDSVVRDIPVLVDLAFDSNDQKTIKSVIDEWNYAMNGWIHIHIVGYIFVDKNELYKNHTGWLFIKALPTDQSTIEHDKNQIDGYKSLGFVNYIGGNQLSIVRSRIDGDITEIMRHEVGHLMGAIHDASGLMDPYFNKLGYQCIDKKTIEEVSKAQILPIETLNYCTFN